jgi:hypothetical protein
MVDSFRLQLDHSRPFSDLRVTNLPPPGQSHLKSKNETANALKGHGFSRAAEIHPKTSRCKYPPALPVDTYSPFHSRSVPLGTAEAVPFQNRVSPILKCDCPASSTHFG